MTDQKEPAESLQEHTPEKWRNVLYLILLAPLYVLVARAGLFFVYRPSGVSSIWPVSGLALAVLLLNRRRSWPAIIPVLFIANICANLLGGAGLPVSLGFALANCAETTLIASLLVRFLLAQPARPEPSAAGLAVEWSALVFGQVNQVLGFFGIVTLGNALTALLGAATVALFLGGAFWHSWLTWCIADGLGILLVTPLILAWKPPYHVDWARLRLSKFLEGAALFSLTAITAGILFLGNQAVLGGLVVQTYLLFPFLIWAGLRFNRRVVTILLAFTSLLAILGNLNDLGQFASPGQSPEQRLLVTQLYLGVLILTTFVLSAMFRQLEQARLLQARSERWYRDLVQNASIGIFHSRPGAGFLMANPALAEMLGYASAQELQATVTNIGEQLYVDSPNYQSVLENILREDGWTYAVNRYRRKDGSLMTGKLAVRKVLAPDGSLSYLEGFVEDITERMRAEAALRESEERFRLLFERAPLGYQSLDARGNFIEVNDTWLEILGYTRQEVIGNWFGNFMAPEYVETVKKRFAQFIEQGSIHSEFEMIKKGGSRVFVAFEGRIGYTPAGEFKQTHCVFTDITERKLTEQALMQSEQKFRSILDSSPTAMQLYRLEAADNLVLTGANPAADRILRISHQQYTGWKIEDAFPGLANSEFVEKCKGVARGELGIQSVELEYQDERFDGIFDVHIFQTSPGLISVDFVDISERRAAERISQARLRLVEYSSAHNLEELLRATLDEAEALTGSQIGFYHTLETDQATPVLQTWSTRTVEEFCVAHGEGSHFPVGEAGVWMDCVKERGPVIHNDYASLTHRKGLPEGHTPLKRELVVPVMRGESIVSILGVGNKLRDYTQRDVSAVSQLADMAWDITERKRAEQALKKSETLLNETQALSKVGGWEYDSATKKMTWTREVYHIYGVPDDYDPGDLVRNFCLFAPDDRAVMEEAFYQALNEGQAFDLELRFTTTEGKQLWVHTSGHPVISGERVEKVTGNIMDITANKLAEENLRKVNTRLAQQLATNEALQALLIEQSTHDALTGLFNRRYMDDSLERELARAHRESYPISVMMIDIDHFKLFNDRHGHAAGDQVLMALGDLLRTAVRESDIPCRYGGEEFVIILPEANLKDAFSRAEHIREEFSQMEMETFDLAPTLSVGLAVYPEHGASVDELIKAADTALYAAKAAGRNCVMVAQS
ncbi:MAG TPA: PAS domain S-box protein [Anaerolineales bacterium]